MKTVKYLISVIALVIGVQTFAQNHDHSKMAATKTEIIKVSGSCDMCKERIEKAAKVDGVTKAAWDSKTQKITITYHPSKVSSETIQKKIAAVGHDTEKFKADPKTYNALPGCCKYR